MIVSYGALWRPTENCVNRFRVGTTTQRLEQFGRVLALIENVLELLDGVIRLAKVAT